MLPLTVAVVSRNYFNLPMWIGLHAGLFAAEGLDVRIGWTSGDGAQDPYAVGAREFQKSLAARIGERIEVQLYPNHAIGDERPPVDGMRLGTVDMGVITDAVIAQVEPAFQVNDMPFLFSSEAQGHRVLDGAMGNPLKQRQEAKGIVPLGHPRPGPPSTKANGRWPRRRWCSAGFMAASSPRPRRPPSPASMRWSSASSSSAS